MTLGEKIRLARKCAGLSQGQLAEKICVSRSAIAKWETDKGLPDVENLKTLSRLLRVSVDSLLSDGEEASAIRETVDLQAQGKGCDRVRRDRLMCHRFPGARIYPLQGRPSFLGQPMEVNQNQGFRTQDPFGVPAYVKNLREPERAFYLVEYEEDCCFVTIENNTMEIRLLPNQPEERRFSLGIWEFVRLEALSRE